MIPARCVGVRPGQAEIGLVNQCGRLQGLSRCLLGEARLGQLPKFGVDQREQRAGRLAIPSLNSRPDLFDFRHRPPRGDHPRAGPESVRKGDLEPPAARLAHNPRPGDDGANSPPVPSGIPPVTTA